MIIFLIGPGGVGKTTSGKIFADKLKYQFLDLDEEFCKRNEIIGEFINKYGYKSYCKKNSSLFFQLVENCKEENTVFVLSSGFLVHEGLNSLTQKHLKALKNHGFSICLLPNKDKKIASEIVVNRQLKRGFGLNKNREKQKFNSRYDKYKKLGDIVFFSSDNPENIAKIMLNNSSNIAN